jgi:hypothetical protein
MKNDFIPGIFNYCDKWCSRCEFKKRCSVYVDDNSTDNDLPNEALIIMITDKLKALSEIFEHSPQLMPYTTDVVYKEFALAGKNEMEKTPYFGVRNSIMSKANEYGRLAANWLGERKVDEAIQIFSEKLDLDLVTIDEIALELDTVQEWLDEITHFMTFIPAKIKRAVASARRQKEWDFQSGFPRDSEGSAKIAVLAIEQSIKTWEKLMAYFPGLEDDCLDFLARLQHLEELTLKEFPNAMNFIRPGFDEIHEFGAIK